MNRTLKLLTLAEMKALVAANITYGVTALGFEFFTGPRYQAVEREDGRFDVFDYRTGAARKVEVVFTRQDAMLRAAVK